MYKQHWRRSRLTFVSVATPTGLVKVKGILVLERLGKALLIAFLVRTVVMRGLRPAGGKYIDNDLSQASERARTRSHAEDGRELFVRAASRGRPRLSGGYFCE